VVPDEHEAHSRVALLELTAARFPARTTPDGDPVLLADQDRRRWDRSAIRRGRAALARADAVGAPGHGRGPYGLQAAIAECHAVAASGEETDWDRVVLRYEALGRLAPSAAVELNRAVAGAGAAGARGRGRGAGPRRRPRRAAGGDRRVPRGGRRGRGDRLGPRRPPLRGAGTARSVGRGRAQPGRGRRDGARSARGAADRRRARRDRPPARVPPRAERARRAARAPRPRRGGARGIRARGAAVPERTRARPAAPQGGRARRVRRYDPSDAVYDLPGQYGHSSKCST